MVRICRGVAGKENYNNEIIISMKFAQDKPSLLFFSPTYDYAILLSIISSWQKLWLHNF